MSILNTFNLTGDINPVTEPLDVNQNGDYVPPSGVDGFAPVHVNVQPNVEPISVTQNGDYSAPSGVDGYNPVHVNVQPTLETLNVAENGTYTPPQGVDGYAPVNVDVDRMLAIKVMYERLKQVTPVTSYSVCAYLLVDNNKQGYGKVATGVYTDSATGAIWERGHLTDDNVFVVDETVVETGDEATLDWSSVQDWFTVYRICYTGSGISNNWDKTLFAYMPVVAVVGYSYSINPLPMVLLPPQGSFGVFPCLQRLYWNGVNGRWQQNYTRPSDSIIELDMSSVTTWQGNMINLNQNTNYLTLLETLKFPITAVDLDSAFNSTFVGNTHLLEIDMSTLTVPATSTAILSFERCGSLNKINMSGWDISAWTRAPLLTGCYNLTNLVLTNSTWVPANTSFAYSPKLTHDSLVALITALPELSGVTRTLTLHADALARLSPAEIDVATQKGWTVA